MTLERSVLASAMLSQAALSIAVHALGTAGAFSDDDNRAIWESIVGLYRRGAAVDYVTVLEDVRSRRLLSPESLRVITDSAHSLPSSAHAGAYCEQLLTIARRDVLLEDISELTAACTGGASVESISKLAARVSVSAKGLRGQAVPVAVNGHVDSVVQALVHEWDMKEMSGEMTGFAGIDYQLRGMKRGELLILAARPGIGKSAVLLNIAMNVARAGRRVLLYSLEMDAPSLIRRMIAGLTGHDLRVPMPAAQRPDSLHAAAQSIKDMGICLDCTAGLDLSALESSVYRYSQQSGPPAIVIVDYLQLLRVPGSKARWEEVSAVSRGLKSLAMDTGCPVLSAAQLSRETEKSGKPQLFHLRESGSIEQDADVVMLLHREQDHPDELEVNIAKNRHGPTGSAKLIFDRRTQSIRAFGTAAQKLSRPAHSAHSSIELTYGEDEEPF